VLISYYFGPNDVCRAASGAREVPYIHHQYAAMWFLFHVGLNVCIILDQFLG
jgi:hypothetical protein